MKGKAKVGEGKGGLYTAKNRTKLLGEVIVDPNTSERRIMKIDL